MKLMVAGGLVLLGLSASLAQEGKGKDDKGRRVGTLKTGDAAPDFEVKDVEGKETVKLSKLRGKPVVLIFGSCT